MRDSSSRTPPSPPAPPRGCRAALAAAGATRLQVNVDDEPVAPAMRIPTTTPPIGAVLSVWTDGGADSVAVITAALTGKGKG